MKGKRGLIMGVANNHSIAWGIAKALSDQGADIAFTYQGAQFEKRVRPLAQEAGSDFLLECDVSDEENLDAMFETLRSKWDSIDFLVHAIAYSNKDELKGRYVD